MIRVRVRVRVRVSIGSLAHDVDASREQLEEHVQLQGMCRANLQRLEEVVLV